MLTVTSLAFLVFFAATLVVYYCTPHRFKWWVLLVASVTFFVLAAGWEALPYLFLGIAITYAGAWLMDNRCKTGKQRKTVLTITLILTLAQLILLKYINPLIQNVNTFGSLFHIRVGLQSVSLVAPLGISYYTLTLIGYVLDVYWGKCHAQGNPLKHALFTCYFPQMVSGPITRYPEMQAQLFGPHSFDYEGIRAGLQRMLWGYFKKMVIADRLAMFVNGVYGDTTQYEGFYIATAVVFFVIQLYMDFSGCIDVMLGASEALGIRLPENFRTPFFSQSMQEFWQRWHITLGLWFKDYVLYPLLKSKTMQSLGAVCKKAFGKKAGKKIPAYLGLVVVWMLNGLWHGGNAKFLFIGALVSFYLVMGAVLSPLCEKMTVAMKIRTECFSFKLFRSLRTFAMVASICVFIPAESLLEGFRAGKRMIACFNPWVLAEESFFKMGLDHADFSLIALCLLVVLVVEAMQNCRIRVRGRFNEQNIAFTWFFMLAGIFGVIIFGIYGSGYNAAEFIYQGF